MSCQVRRGVAVVALAFAAVAPTGHAQEKEPTFKGRPLSAWVADLKDKDSYKRTDATWALRDLGGAAQTTAPALLEVLQADVSAVVRGGAAQALGRLAPTADTVRALVAALKDRDLGVRMHATKSLWLLAAATRPLPAAADAVPALVALCKGGEGSIRNDAVGALGAIGSEAKEAVPTIAELLSLTDPCKIEAARALGRIGVASKDAVARLARALELSPPRKAVPGVSDAGPLLRNDFCQAALESLGKFGPAAKEALPVVRRFCDDPVWPVRDAARAALKQIAPGN